MRRLRRLGPPAVLVAAALAAGWWATRPTPLTADELRFAGLWEVGDGWAELGAGRLVSGPGGDGTLAGRRWRVEGDVLAVGPLPPQSLREWVDRVRSGPPPDTVYSVVWVGPDRFAAVEGAVIHRPGEPPDFLMSCCPRAYLFARPDAATSDEGRAGTLSGPGR